MKTKIKRCQQQKYINLNADTLTKTWCNKQHWRMKPPYMWNVVHNMWNTSINWITTWIKSERDSWRMIYVEPSHRSRNLYCHRFNIWSQWKLNSGEFLRLLEQFTATHKTTIPFFKMYRCINYPEFINAYNTNFQLDFYMTFSVFPHDAS